MSHMLTPSNLSCVQNTKKKLIYPVVIREVKQHLRIDNDFTDDEAYLERLIKTATVIAENYIEKDIAKTENELRIDDFSSDNIKIHEGNFLSIKSIIDSNLVPIETTYQTTKHDDFFQIEWDSYLCSNPIYINYYTGFEEDQTPDIIKHCVLIIIADLYDNQRSNMNWNGIVDNKVWQTILDSYKIIRF